MPAWGYSGVCERPRRQITHKGPSEAAGAPAGGGGGGAPLPSDALKTAREAAEASGEALPVFVGRAVGTQAQRDRAMKKAPDKKSEV